MSAIVSLAVSLFLPKRYEARMKVLVKRERPNTIVAPQSAYPIVSADVTEQDVNAEVEILNSAELMKDVVRRTGLDAFHLASKDHRNVEVAIELAARSLATHLTVTPLRKASIIQITYSATDPTTAHTVLRNLAELYLQSHLRAHRAPGAFEFFKTQAERYEGELSQAQARFDSFKARNNVVQLVEQKQLLLKRVLESEQAANEVTAAIAETSTRVKTLKNDLATLQLRVVTQTRAVPNHYSVERLHTMLAELRNRRTDLLSKYQPEDRLVRDIEKQIADTTAALDRARVMTSVEETTDVNPIRQTLEGEYARLELQLAGLAARKTAVEAALQEARGRLQALSTASTDHDALKRAVTNAEENAVLYAKKREEARISDSLDEQNFANASIIEQPRTPLLPTAPNTTLYAVAACVLALFISIGSAFALNAMNPTFTTPYELERFAPAPVFEAVPVVEAYQES